MTNDIIVKLIDFPTNTKEVVTQNEDGSYTIFLNSRLTYEMRLGAYAHALSHITENDFEKQNADEIEFYTHQHSNY